MSLQSATRRTALKTLPPVLHFSLMRFAYDPYSGSRKKSKDTISYPRSITLNNEKYDLRGVVLHQGTSVSWLT
jgi:ubiquitin carboxyl-terminal hydrolase 48